MAATGHWAIAAPAAAWELAENAACVFLRQVTTGLDSDQTWWEAVDEFVADLTTDGDRLCLAHLRRNHQAWLV